MTYKIDKFKKIISYDISKHPLLVEISNERNNGNVNDCINDAINAWILINNNPELKTIFKNLQKLNKPK